MNWTEVKITTNQNGIETLTGVLLNIGITGIRIENANDFNEFLDGTEIYWDYVDESLMYLKDCETKVILYIPENSQGLDMLTSLKQELSVLKETGEFGDLTLEFNNVKEEDWENNWKKYFKPLKVGKKFLIKPSWEEADNTENRKILEIDPGMSFGTGTHETTRLCLETMDTISLSDKKVLDLGCGSGILSIGALLSGANDVTLVDIDFNSTKIATENILKNGFSNDLFKVYCGNVLEDDLLCEKIGFNTYDVIFANIVADVLKAMSPLFKKFLKQGGTLIVSGIITERKDEVLNKIKSEGFTVLEEKQDGAWALAVLKNSD